VLDYHLIENDSGPALEIVRKLARGEAPNLVVLYTADPSPTSVLISVAAVARGSTAAASLTELDSDLEDLNVPWSEKDVVAFIHGRRDWVPTFRRAIRDAGLGDHSPASGEVLLERHLAGLGAEKVERAETVEKIAVGEHLRWFQCGNLFLTVVTKSDEHNPEEEAERLLAELEKAIIDWAPEWLACLIAASRRTVEVGSFRDDARLPEPALRGGLLRYVRNAGGEEEAGRRAREIAAHVLSRRFHSAAEEMGLLLHQRAASYQEPHSENDRNAELLHLNAFLCSEEFRRHHLRVGSVFRREATDEYWVCVTPACDMVPRTRSAEIDPWASELDPVRPMLALRLTIQAGTSALPKAEQGRYLFFRDQSKPDSGVVVAAAFNTTTDDPNPRIEQMFAMGRAVVVDGRVSVQRCIREAGQDSVTLQTVTCVPACQLRAPYAERLTHVVGGHLSRIGVNFLRSEGGAVPG